MGQGKEQDRVQNVPLISRTRRLRKTHPILELRQLWAEGSISVSEPNPDG